MLPLQSSASPLSSAELQSALGAGLRQYGLSPRSVEVAGANWPALDKLTLDLTGAEATRDLRLPAVVSGSGPEITVAELVIRAEPLLLEGTPLVLELQARDAAFAIGEKLLSLRRSGPGRLSISIGKSDLEKLALEAAREAGKQHGAQVQELHLNLTSETERAIRFQAEVTAKMGFMKATLTLSGRAELDAELRLHLSDLDLKGQGMASTLAAGFIRPQLEKVQKAPIPLTVLSLGDVRLRDLKLTTGETLRAEASFSS